MTITAKYNRDSVIDSWQRLHEVALIVGFMKLQATILHCPVDYKSTKARNSSKTSNSFTVPIQREVFCALNLVEKSIMEVVTGTLPVAPVPTSEQNVAMDFCSLSCHSWLQEHTRH